MKRALLVVVAVALLLPLASERVGAQASPLKFFTNYFITGDYAVGGASLWRKGVDGVASAQFSVPGVPAGVDIVAAFLYLQTAEVVQWSGIHNARFNGIPLGPGTNNGDETLAKALNWELGTPPCWSIGTGSSRRMVTYRVDALRFLPIGADGKHDLTGQHTIEVPDYGYLFPDLDELGTESPSQIGARAVGASMVVIYKDYTKPLRGIVLYDGGHTKQAFANMSLLASGFYQASLDPAAPPKARMTHIVGDGRPYLSERVRVGGAIIATNPYASTAGPKWDNPTFGYNWTTGLGGLPIAAGAASANVEVTPNGLLSDCVTHSGWVFSTAVQDTDEDGLLDIWETSTGTLYDPNGRPLPPLNAMGADPNERDVFVEVGSMFTTGDTTYGTGADAEVKLQHSHQPPPEALKKIGEAFNKEGIRLHFDMGPLYAPGVASPYVIPAGVARGGEEIDEQATVCDPAPDPDAPPWQCQFQAYPGTVGWKTGFRFLRDEVFSITPPVGPTILPPFASDPEEFCSLPGYSCERRFDANRHQTFRYLLAVHSVGLPKSEFACLNGTTPADGDSNGACTGVLIPNPQYRIPVTNTGIGEFPGSDSMIALGAFPDEADLPIGTVFQQAATIAHELGHGFLLRHGGGAFEPNCKPNYFSWMNYAYQLRGLLDDEGNQHLDLSHGGGGSLNETTLTQVPITGLLYRLGWFAPLAGSYLEGQITAADRHCDGSPLLPTDVPMVRFDALSKAENSDWDSDNLPNAAGDPDPVFSPIQDINFNGRTTVDGTPSGPAETLSDSNDWANLRLNQIQRRNVGGLYEVNGLLAVGPLSANAGKGDLGKGDLGKGDLGIFNFDILGKGDLGKGDLGKGDLGLGVILGKGDLGKGDLGGGELFDSGPYPGGEINKEIYTLVLGGDIAFTFTACVIGVDCDETEPENNVLLEWTSGGGDVTHYVVFRVPGSEILARDQWTEVETVQAADEIFQAIDNDQLIDGQEYTYFVTANVGDKEGPPSNAFTITAVNPAPIAENDAYSTDEDTPLVVPGPTELPHLLDNDTDNGPLIAVLVVGEEEGPHNGSVVVLDNGAFTYTPDDDFHGVDTFRYVARSGEVDSEPATVTITVNSVNDPPEAEADAYETDEDTPLTVEAPGVLANDSDADGIESLVALLAEGPLHGEVELNESGGFVYRPDTNYHGLDSFTYSAFDGEATTLPVTVTLTVTAINDPPGPDGDNYSTPEDTLLYVGAAAGVLANDVDPDSTLTAVLFTSPLHGALTLNANGSFTYTPHANYNGPDLFTYKATDGGPAIGPVTVNIFVTAVNDVPVANANAYEVNQGSVLTIAGPGVLGNDTDADVLDDPPPPALTAVLVAQPAPNKGIVTLNADGGFIYTPPPNFFGVATFTYRASDGSALSADPPTTVSITVKAVGYELLNVKNLPPATGVTFKPGTFIEFKWKFKQGGAVVASANAQPSVTITGPNNYNLVVTPETCSLFGLLFWYNSNLQQWQLTWKAPHFKEGTYKVVVKSGKTLQSFPSPSSQPAWFPVVVKY